MKQSYRIDLVHGMICTKKNTFIPSMFLNDPIINGWYRKYTVFLRSPRNWNNTRLVMALCDFDNILKYISSCVAINTSSFPTAVKSFITYMTEVNEAALVANVKLVPGPKIYGNQPKAGAYEFTHMQTHNLCDALNAY